MTGQPPSELPCVCLQVAALPDGSVVTALAVGLQHALVATQDGTVLRFRCGAAPEHPVARAHGEPRSTATISRTTLHAAAVSARADGAPTHAACPRCH